MRLIKCSAPGFEEAFSNEGELKAELFKYICTYCRKADYLEWPDGTIDYKPGITEESSLEEMLASACGCEFVVE